MAKTPLDLVQTIKDLPAMPNVIVKALGVIKDDTSGCKELSEIMSYDQALAAQVLKLVNSSYYGFAQEITSIKNAISLLGMTQTKNIVIAVAMKPMLTSQCGRDMWKHSLKTAIACEHLAKIYDTIDPADAFTIGFLHDIGKIVLNLTDTEKYQQVKNAVADGVDVIVAEEEAFCVNHADIGFLLVKKWKLPVLLANCVKYHHDPMSSSMPKASALIYLADQLCQERPEIPTISAVVKDEFNVDMAQLEEIRAEINEIIEELISTIESK